MADSTLSHLNYGHAGTSTFNIESQDWSFVRRFTATTLKQVGIRNRSSIETIPAPVQIPQTTFSTRLTDAKHNARAILDTHPQLGPASHLISDLAATSAAVLSTTSNYDPLIGSLYSTGSITYTSSRAYNWDNPRRIAATVTGEAGNILRLSFLHQESLGWQSDKSVWIRGDTLKNTETGYWNEEAAPIQQVCYSQADDRSTLLAVRLLTKTIIFRPFYSQRPQPAAYSRYYHLPPSLINANPILSLDNEETGGAPHVDVTFNSDFQLQFAVVDQNHVWSVWDIDHKRRSTEYKLSCLVQGHIILPEDADTAGQDGWARILWVGDVNTMLVCNRRQLSIIGIEGASFTYLSCPAVISQRSSDWILDVKRHPVIRGRFFVLTSTELCLMGVTTPSEAVDTTVGPVGARVLFSWRHYRGAEDFTLSISVSMLNEDEVCVLLLSRLNNLTQTYIIANTLPSNVALSSSSDPTLLDLAMEGSRHTLQLAMEPFQVQGDTSSSTPSLGRTYFAQGIAFYKLFLLRSDLSVHESIVYAPPPHAETAENFDVDDLLWTIVYRPKKNVSTIGDVQEMDDFLEPEGIEALGEPMSKLPLQVPTLTGDKGVDIAHREVDHQPLYDALAHNYLGDETVGFIHIPDVVSRLQEILMDSTETSQLPLETVLEFAKTGLDIPDIDQASSALQALLHADNQHDDVDVRCIASAPLLQLEDNERPTISALYDGILHSWIATLPPQVSTRVRQHKERLARRVAAEVTMAAIRVFQRETQSAVVEGQPGISLDSGTSMPILPSQPLGGSSQNWASSQPLPTPTPSYPQSQPPTQQTYLSSSQYSSSQPNRTFTFSTSTDPLIRLRKHLKFNDDVVSQDTISDGVNRLLSQWHPGMDPRTYNWDASERATRIDANEENEQQLEKARRRKERRERKQRRENELAQAQPSGQPFSLAPTFVKPTIFPRSSPGPMHGATSQLPGASSQSQEFGGFSFPVQSQIEVGKFGGRPDKKKKKKGRVSGF